MQAELRIAGLDEVFDEKVEEAVRRIESAYRPVLKELIELKELLKSKFGLSDESYLDKKQVAEIIGRGGKNNVYINEMINKGTFPKPERYESNKFPMWKVETVKNWLKEKDEFWRWTEWERRKIKGKLNAK